MPYEHNIQFPPDSTGKRVAHTCYIDLVYTSGTIPFVVGDLITTPTTLIKGRVIYVEGTTIDGFLHVLLDFESPQTINVGEALQVNAVTYAIAGAIAAMFTPKFVQSSGDNPLNTQTIDNKGAANIRFAEGAQQFDAYGLTRTSQQNHLGEYIHTYNKLPDEWQEVIVGTASCIHLPNEGGVRFQVGTAAGDKIQRTTHRYHQLQAGYSQLIELELVSGDYGKANLVRRAGYYDDFNGVFFEMGTAISIVVRSSSTGSIIDSPILSTNWNGDKLDGSGLSLITMNPVAINNFWFDFQGNGRLRFGIFGRDGERVVVHTIYNSNNSPYPFIGTGTLPIRQEMFNTGVTNSVSEIKVYNCSVKTEGPTDAIHSKWHHMKSSEIPSVSLTSTYKPIASGRSSLVLNGIVNRVSSVPEVITGYVKTSAVRIKLIKNATLVDATWATQLGAIDIDMAATSYSGGEEHLTLEFDVGSNSQDIQEHFSILREALRLNADGTHGNTYTLVAKSMETASDISLTVGWFDTVGL